MDTVIAGIIIVVATGLLVAVVRTFSGRKRPPTARVETPFLLDGDEVGARPDHSYNEPSATSENRPD